MNWKQAIQISVVAIIGAGIFEAGRLTAMREYVRGAYDTAVAEDPTPIQAKSNAIRSVKPKLVKKSAPTVQEPMKPESTVTRKKYADPPLIARDQEMIATAERIMRTDDFEAACKFAPAAAKASRREVREAAVAMLGWFGKKGIAELTPFLSDKDPDVAMDAAGHWRRIFSNECDDSEKMTVATLVMTKLTSVEMLKDLGVEDAFNDMADESRAVEVLIAIIKDGSAAGIEVAKDAYDTVTGEAWKSEEAARSWIKENDSGEDRHHKI